MNGSYTVSCSLEKFCRIVSTSCSGNTAPWSLCSLRCLFIVQMSSSVPRLNAPFTNWRLMASCLSNTSMSSVLRLSTSSCMAGCPYPLSHTMISLSCSLKSPIILNTDRLEPVTMAML